MIKKKVEIIFFEIWQAISWPRQIPAVSWCPYIPMQGNSQPSARAKSHLMNGRNVLYGLNNFGADGKEYKVVEIFPM